MSLVLIPWGCALVSVPNLALVYSQAGARQLAVPLLYGAGWGVANVLFGLAVIRIGMALAFATTIGLSAALGTLVALVFQHRQVLTSISGLWIISGVLVMVGGIAVCSWAGWRRDGVREAHREQSQSIIVSNGHYSIGLLLGITVGLLAPMMNYALAFGGCIITEALRQGTKPALATYAVWPIALGGGLLANASYSIYLLGTKRTWDKFCTRRLDALPSLFMGVLFMGAVSADGMATTRLGPLGPSIGWALFQILIIISANLSGSVTGEWRGVGRKTLYLLSAGLLLRALATGMIAHGNSQPTSRPTKLLAFQSGKKPRLGTLNLEWVVDDGAWLRFIAKDELPERLSRRSFFEESSRHVLAANSAPIGPWIVTREEIPEWTGPNLGIELPWLPTGWVRVRQVSAAFKEHSSRGVERS